MGRRADNRRYATQRTLLILLMGSKCMFCPERRPWLLEFHHPKGRSWKAHKTSRCRRIKKYIKDYGNGLLKLACVTCNKKHPPKEEETIPF